MPRMADPSQPGGASGAASYQAPPPASNSSAPAVERCAQCQTVGVPLLAPDEPVGMTPSPGSLNKPR